MPEIIFTVWFCFSIIRNYHITSTYAFILPLYW